MNRPRIIVAAFTFACLFVLASSAGGPSGSAPPGHGGPAYVPGEILLKFKTEGAPAVRTTAMADLQARVQRVFRSGGEHWVLGPGHTVEEALAKLKANPWIKYAEPNYIIKLDAIPNDPRFPEMYGLRNTGQTGGTPDADIDADMAWDVSTGSPNVIVADIDTGLDYNHPDIAANVWTNPGEIPGNGIDDDNNGFIDDVHGYDFVNNDGDPFDDHGHGTHTAGTIGAVGDNGIGVVGVNWHVRIMSLKFLDSGGSGTTANAVRAVDYSVMMGADLSSNSWGGGGFSQALYDSIANAGAHNMAFVAAAGNSGVNTDISPNYPSAYDLANIIAVAATDNNDALASFSNWGPTTVDLGAPGVDILSTLPGNSYGTLSGTSMATPHVAGTCALIRSVSPNIPVGQMKSVLLGAVDHIASMNGKVLSNGRLNAFFAIATPDNVPPGTISDLATTDPGSNTMGLTWTATGDDGTTGTATYYEVRWSTSPIDSGNWGSATRAGNEPTPLVSGSAQSMEVHGLAANTFYYFAIRAFDEWGNSGPVSNLASGTTLPSPTGSVDPTSVSATLFTGQQTDQFVTLSNIGVGTLDFTLATPILGEPMSVNQPLDLGKDDADPRSGSPVLQASGGPDGFGYTWVDSDAPGGPTFAWTDISGTGTDLNLTTDDQTSGAVALGFDMPFYGTLFNSIRVCTNGFISFTSTSNAYSNQPLPNSGAPENLVAPFWDDLHPHTVGHIYFQSFGTRAIVQWNTMERYSGAGQYTFEAILDASGAITYQYLDMTSGDLTSATVGIQNAAKTTALQVAFNQSYLHDNLAVRIASVPRWLSASPTSGRLGAGQSKLLRLHMDASGLEGGTYPGQVPIQTNDPSHPVLMVDASLHVIGAPDAVVQPTSIAFGDSFVGLPHQQPLIVFNNGTDTLHVTGIPGSAPEVSASPASFNVAPHGSQQVTVTWTPSGLGPFSGSLTVQSDDAGEPNIVVPVTGNAIPAPVMVVTPSSFEETLYSGQNVGRTLTVQNTGGSSLSVNASASLCPVVDEASGSGEGAAGSGGPDASGYRWKDSDVTCEPPIFAFADISTTGTTIIGSSVDDSLSSAVNMGMSFPFYGNNFTQFKVSSNGWLTFTTTETLNRLTNFALPTGTGNTNGAPNMIALFWDDLHTRNGNVKWLNDGTRVIVQFTNVEKFSPAGNPMTFQVQLYPNGKILLIYKTMPVGGTYNSATIGIQNQAKTTGLQVDFNANYVHSNLGVQISRIPDWLTVTPAHADVAPGGSFNFNVAFDATDRLGGPVNGDVVLHTNIPTQTQVNIPALLHVIGAPTVGIVPTSFGYGTRFTGYSHLTTFQVVNTGTDVLNVTDVSTDDASLTVQDAAGSESIDAAFPLPPGGSHVFSLLWQPTVPGALNAHVHVLSNDPVTPNKTMAVTGVAIDPPITGWSPTSFTESFMVGDIVHRNLHVTNTGGSDLNYDTLISLNSGASVPVYPPVELKKDVPDTTPGLLGSGGPDVFGYRWRDSDELGGPVFSWIDITGIGTHLTALNADDQNVPSIPLGFAFPFYGTTFNTVNVCSNGWLSFTSTSTSLSNSALPSTGAPLDLIAPFWDDLSFSSTHGSGQAYYYSDGNRFIFSFINVPHYPSTGTGPYTFQVIFYRSGRIVYQYQSVGVTLDSATIGIQNATGTDGLTVDYNAAYVHNNLAVDIRPPAGWLSVNPAVGTIPAGGSADLDVTFDTTDMIGGDYTGSIDMSTNDPAHGLIQIPAAMHLTGIPDIAAAPSSLSFAMTYTGFSRSLPVMIQNDGTDVLHISGFSMSGDFSQTGMTAPVALPVGGVIPVTVTFTPTSAGTLTGSLTVTSDDPDEATFSVPLTGIALIPPAIGLAPSEIHTALPPGGTRTKTLTVHNTGGSDLTWTSSSNIISAHGQSTIYGTLDDLGKGDVDPREGILGSGGPDVFGYKWKDSDEPGGPLFNWVDISGVGTRVSFGSGDCDDCASGPFSIGFPFNYYGNTFSSFRVNTNGWLSFTSTISSGSFAYSNQLLPTGGASYPENLLALFWDDLVHRDGSGEPRASAVYYYYDGTRLIVQYQHMYRIANFSGDDLNFEVILYPSGKIVYQYETMASTTLNSSTIGTQNATRNDGLNVVFDANYVHNNMAIEFSKFPEWVKLAPTSGTIPAGGSQDLVVTLDAAGLADGDHTATLGFDSNDPYRPHVDVPVTLHVGLVNTTYANFDPDLLNLSSNGNFVTMTVQLPVGLDPHNINLSSVTLNGSVPALSFPPPEYGDQNNDGIVDVKFKFDRQAFEAVVPTGSSVPVTIQGEVTDVQWWTGTDYIRTMNPHVKTPAAGAYILSGATVPITWDPPTGGNVNHYVVQLSRDGGVTWEELNGNVHGTSYNWTASGALTSDARVRIIAMDSQGVMGYGWNDGAFTIATSTLQPPNEVGATLLLRKNGSFLTLEWKAPAADPTHGPADHYRVLRSTGANGTFEEVGVVTTIQWTEDLSSTQGLSLLYYKVVAVNAAGEER